MGVSEESAPSPVKLEGDRQRESETFPKSHRPHPSFPNSISGTFRMVVSLNQVTFLSTEAQLPKRMLDISKGNGNQGCLAFVGGSCEHKCHQRGMLETLRHELPACGRKCRIESARKVKNTATPDTPNCLFLCCNQARRRLGKGITVLLRDACSCIPRVLLGTTCGV